MWKNDERIIIHSKSPYEIQDGPLFSLLGSLKQSYRIYKDSAQLSGIIDVILDQAEDPYNVGLKLMYSSGDFLTGKNATLASAIARGLERYANKHLNEPIPYNLKESALELSLEQFNVPLRVSVANAFRLVEDNERLASIVDNLIEKKLFRDACQVAGMLNLQVKYTPEQFLVPLLLQDKIQLMEDYIACAPKSVQETFIKYLDDILCNPQIGHDLINKMQVRNTRADKLSSKQLSKLIIRLLRKLNLSSDQSLLLAPNTCLRRQRSGMKYLLYQRSTGQMAAGAAWDEMVSDAVRDVPELQKELVDAMFAMGWHSDAKRMSQQFGISVDKEKVEDFFEVASASTSDETSSNSTTFLTLPLPEQAIILVNTKQAFEAFLCHISKIDLMAIDCEWKPNFGLCKNQLSLIQIATESMVHLLDVLALQTTSPDFTHHLNSVLFEQPILKLGFGMSSDLHMLTTTLGLPSNTKATGFIDLQHLVKNLVKHGFHFPYTENANDASGLSNVTSSILGFFIDKSEQFSNWDLRPLRFEQIKYAGLYRHFFNSELSLIDPKYLALDAYCLIMIWNKLREECLKQNIEWDSTVEEMSGYVSSTSEIVQAPQKASEIQLVCPEELLELAKVLRDHGINTLVFRPKEISKSLMKSLRKSTALIISKNPPDRRLKNYLPAVQVRCQNPERQMIDLLIHLSVDIDSNNLRPRCEACNETGLREVHRDTIREIQLNEETLQNLSYGLPPEEIDCDENYFDCGFSDDDCDDDYHHTPHFEPNKEPQMSLNVFRTKVGVLVQTKEIITQELMNQHEWFFFCEDCGSFQPRVVTYNRLRELVNDSNRN